MLARNIRLFNFVLFNKISQLNTNFFNVQKQLFAGNLSKKNIRVLQ